MVTELFGEIIGADDPVCPQLVTKSNDMIVYKWLLTIV